MSDASERSTKLARAWFDGSSLGEFADFSDDSGYERHLVNSLAAEFKELLPEGSVAVDGKKLLEAMRTGIEWTGGTCPWPACGSLTEGAHPHVPGCPLGGDDDD